MSEEVTNEAVEPEAPVEAVSDTTAEGVTEEVVEASATEAEIPSEEASQVAQPAQEVGLPEEPTDNAVRSQMGRKLKYMEEKMDESFNKLDAFLQSQSQPQYQQPQQHQPIQEEVDEEFLTNRNLGGYVKDMFNQYQTEQSTQTTKYNDDYVKTINRLGSDLSDADFDEIDAERMKNFNQAHSMNGNADAESNWQKAEISVLRKRQASPTRKAPLKQERPSAPLGGGGTQTSTAKKTKMPKFDEATLSYMKSRGISEEKAAKILGNAR